MVNDTDIVELELKSKRFSLSLKKKAALQEQVVQVGASHGASLCHFKHTTAQAVYLCPASTPAHGQTLQVLASV